MGGASFDPGHWKTFTSTRTSGKTASAIFTAKGIKDSLDPKKMKNMMRESCDDIVCPESTAIIIALDETGSMGDIPEYMIRTGFPKLFTEIYDRKPVKYPHIMFQGIGDSAVMEPSAIQISQFESGMRLADQLADMHLYGGGGGNSCESYTFAWYMAAMHTKIDCWDKRQKKGYLFTVGDENPNNLLARSEIKQYLDIDPEVDFTSKQLLDMVSKMYHVYHIVIEQGNHMRYESNANAVLKNWRDLLNQNVILLSDYTKLSETIVSIIQIQEGADSATVASSWSDDTSLVVRRATSGLQTTGSAKSAVVRF